MTTSIFKALPASESLSPVAQQALDYWRNYGALNREESWRWTPIKPLRANQYPLENADYQLSVPDGMTESVQTSGALEASLLTLADAPFVALNIAIENEALTISVPSDYVADALIALNLDQLRQTMQCSRLNLQVQAGAEVAFWFDFTCADKGAQLPVINLEVAENASVDGALWFGGGAQTAQLAFIHSQQQANSALRLTAVQAGGALARLDVQAQIKGDEARFDFGGVQCLRGANVGDFHVSVRHENDKGESHQLVRGALADESLGIFDGLIYVGEKSKQNNANQDSRYILLSDKAKSHSVPRLEIYAEDVQCAHGSTVGFLDDEAIFYLQSRGISAEEARQMLLLSFLQEAVVVENDLLLAPLKQALTDFWLEGDDD